MRFPILAALCLVPTLAACTPQHTALPALPSHSSGEHRPGQFVWFDLLVDDPAISRAFYGPLFGWTFEPLDDGHYDTILHSGREIGGLIRHTPDDAGQPDDLWLPSLSVADVDAATARAKTDGGRVLIEPRDLGARGRIAVLRDPEGATFALLHSPGGDPPRRVDQAGDFHWVQLWSRDHEVPVEFYDDVAGWQVGEVLAHDQIEEAFFMTSNHRVASVIELPWPHVEPNWLPYVAVDDITETIEKAKKLGGRLLVRGDHVAILQDPSGAAIGIGPLGEPTEGSR